MPELCPADPIPAPSSRCQRDPSSRPRVRSAARVVAPPVGHKGLADGTTVALVTQFHVCRCNLIVPSTSIATALRVIAPRVNIPSQCSRLSFKVLFARQSSEWSAAVVALKAVCRLELSGCLLRTTCRYDEAGVRRQSKQAPSGPLRFHFFQRRVRGLYGAAVHPLAYDQHNERAQ